MLAVQSLHQVYGFSEWLFFEPHTCPLHSLVMTSVFFGASRLRNRLFKALPSLALAATGLVAGASLLSGGEAKAFNCTFGGASPTCTTGVWHPSNPASDKLVKFLTLPTKGVGDIEFQYYDNPPPGLSVSDQWQVDVDFTPDLMPADGVSTFDYLIKIDPTVPHPFDVFKDVSLSGGVIGDAKITKEIWSTNSGGTKKDLLHTLIYDPFNMVYDLHYDLAVGLSELYILDTATPGTVGNGGMIDNYQNTFTQQVPGPLPILGAGAAFGYTRKLRRRVKAMRLA
jgi:hypothetical protein